MAALGAIGRNRSTGTNSTGANTRPGISTFTRTYPAATQVRTTAILANTSISGSTSVNSVLTGNRRVFVYNRDTGKLVNGAISDATGAFTIKGLPVATSKYHVVMEQIATDTGSYNAARFDQITQS